MNKSLLALTGMMAMSGIGGGSGFNYQTGNYNRSYSDTPCKSIDQIKGYGRPVLSQPKKLRKGAGHRKLTRAERKLCKLKEGKV